MREDADASEPHGLKTRRTMADKQTVQAPGLCATMTPCVFLLSEHPAPDSLAGCLAGCWSPTALRRQGCELTGLRASWAEHPVPERLWLLACPAEALGGQLQWLIDQELRDTPVLWWPESPAGLDEGTSSDLENLAWQAGVDEVLWSHQTERHGRQFERALARHQSHSGLGAVLRHRQQELRALRASLNNIPAPIFVKDAEGVYTECNQAFLQYIGLPRHQVVGHTVYDVAPTELARVYDAADRALLAAGGRQIYESQVRWADGHLRDVLFHKAVFHDAQGQPAGQAGAMFDITERRALERQLRQQAETDPLTGLLNRRSLESQLTLRLRRAAEQDAALALLVFDVDHFKDINDGHGHGVGDSVLRLIAEVVGQHLRSDDLFARLGGDEFVVVLAGVEGVHSLAGRLPALVAAQQVALSDGQGLSAQISLGAVVVPAREHTVDSAIHTADLVLYEAKRLGRNQGVVMDTRPGPAGRPPIKAESA